MEGMFYYCDKLKNVNLSYFKSEKVQSTKLMFFWCAELIFVDLSSFELNKVNNKDQMFYLSSFDLANDMYPDIKKIIKIQKNSLEEFKKHITSKSAEIRYEKYEL